MSLMLEVNKEELLKKLNSNLLDVKSPRAGMNASFIDPKVQAKQGIILVLINRLFKLFNETSFKTTHY